MEVIQMAPLLLCYVNVLCLRHMNVLYSHCLKGCHKLLRVKTAPGRVDGFVSTCLMKDIWSIRAYSFSLPFYRRAHGRAGRCPQAFGALRRQHTSSHSFTHTHAYTNTNILYMDIFILLFKPFISYPN